MIHLNRGLSRAAAAAAVLIASSGAFAQSSAVKAVDKATFDRLAPLFQERLGATPETITTSEVPGLYEAFIGDKAFYVTPDGKYVLDGILVDFPTKSNVTETRASKKRWVDVKSLPLADAMKVVRGNGSRMLITLEDPNCGYCKKLAPELDKIKNVTIYRFLLPVLGADSMEKSRATWCAPDRAKAWDAHMTGKPVAARTCDSSAIDRNMDLQRKLNVRGTPTLIFASGERVPGYIPAEEIERKLSVR